MEDGGTEKERKGKLTYVFYETVYVCNAIIVRLYSIVVDELLQILHYDGRLKHVVDVIYIADSQS